MPSSVVSAIHYYPDKKLLRVIYVSGGVYDYKNVPENIYLAMKNAKSKGTYLNKRIKGRYEFDNLNK